MFVALAGIAKDTVHVPYKGGNPAMMATMADEAQFYFGPIAGMVPFIEPGAVQALAISGEERSLSLPDVRKRQAIPTSQIPRGHSTGLVAVSCRNAC